MKTNLERKDKNEKVIEKKIKKRIRRNNQQLKGMKIHSCHQCNRSYVSKAALSYHNKLKHSPNNELSSKEQRNMLIAVMILIEIRNGSKNKIYEFN